VDAVRRWDLVLAKLVGGAHVGRQHALLDQAVGIVALQRHDLLDLLVFIEDDLGLGQFEIDRPAPDALGVQCLE
jgi:hypothetical protein